MSSVTSSFIRRPDYRTNDHCRPRSKVATDSTCHPPPSKRRQEREATGDSHGLTTRGEWNQSVYVLVSKPSPRTVRYLQLVECVIPLANTGLQATFEALDIPKLPSCSEVLDRWPAAAVETAQGKLCRAIKSECGRLRYRLYEVCIPGSTTRLYSRHWKAM